MTARTFAAPTCPGEKLRIEPVINGPSASAEAGQTTPKAEARMALNGPKAGVTFAAQDKLPKLPIPELQDSCKRYQEALKPLQSISEQRDTAAAIDKFLKHEGLELHDRLKKYATGRTSYIEQFCRSRLEIRVGCPDFSRVRLVSEL
jgi:Choline/Carnitine o-acyltransferase